MSAGEMGDAQVEWGERILLGGIAEFPNSPLPGLAISYFQALVKIRSPRGACYGAFDGLCAHRSLFRVI
jgi:hypothetical protein